MRSKNACKTCALGMGGQRGGMVNELGHFPEVCKKSRCRRWSPTCRAPSAATSGSTYSPRELQQLLAARAGSLRPARRSRCSTRRETRPLHADLLGRGARPHRRQAPRDAARRNVLVLQRPQQQRGRLSAATLRPAVRHEQRQQLQLLLPPGERRRPGERHRQRHRDDRARRPRARRPACSSSAATRPATTRG